MMAAARTNFVCTDESNRFATAINMLPDDILLDIFDFCRKNYRDNPRNARICPVWEWHVLVHVCRRWRQIVFGSPIRLNIQILCTYGTPVRTNLDIWPAFPIAVHLDGMRYFRYHNEDEAFAALEHYDRVSIIRLCLSSTHLEWMAAVMREPYPALTSLNIDSWGDDALAFPADFLGGSTPCLQEIILSNFPFPALPTLLLSTSDLVTLVLHKIPPAGYFSPEALGASFAILPNLKTLSIQFRSDTSRPGRLRPPLTTRTVLPFLTSFDFHGAFGYLEALVAQIESPQLNRMSIEYFNRRVDFQVAQLSTYIHCSLRPEQRPFKRANVCFHGEALSFILYSQENLPNGDQRAVEITVACKAFGWQFSPLLQVIDQFHATIYTGTITHLELNINLEGDRQIRGARDVEWLDFLHEFPAMRVLHVASRVLARHIALALEEITVEMAVEVLPFLELVYLEGRPASSIEKFVTARRSTNYPITVVDTTEEFNKRL